MTSSKNKLISAQVTPIKSNKIIIEFDREITINKGELAELHRLVKNTICTFHETPDDYRITFKHQKRTTSGWKDVEFGDLYRG